MWWDNFPGGGLLSYSRGKRCWDVVVVVVFISCSWTYRAGGRSILHPPCASKCHDGFYEEIDEFKAFHISSTTSSHSFSSREEYKGARSPCTLSFSVLLFFFSSLNLWLVLQSGDILTLITRRRSVSSNLAGTVYSLIPFTKRQHVICKDLVSRLMDYFTQLYW